jgi:hypothetical protein
MKKMAGLIGFCKTAILVGTGFSTLIQCKVLRTDLEAGLITLESARPRVWWHWMNGNIARRYKSRS